MRVHKSDFGERTICRSITAKSVRTRGPMAKEPCSAQAQFLAVKLSVSDSTPEVARQLFQSQIQTNILANNI